MSHVNQLMREKKIGILAIQETHMTLERATDIESRFEKRMRVFASEDPEAPTARAGIAVILNRQLVNADRATMEEIIPGRAIMLSVPTYKNDTIRVLAIYAPNNPTANGKFWDDIQEWVNDQQMNASLNGMSVLKPNILLGDFNVVEEAIDRIPVHEDEAVATLALDDLKTNLELIDGWRDTYPDAPPEYTFHQANMQAMSRLDRIYMERDLINMSRNWKIEPSGLETDHQMVSVEVVTRAAPDIGSGRWSIPNHILSDKPLRKYMKEHGLETEEKLKNLEKRKIRRVNGNSMLSEEERLAKAGVLQEKLTQLAQKRHKKRRLDVATRNKLEGETISKYWSQVNKDKKLRDVIFALKKPEPLREDEPIYELDSKKMSNLARNYHENLQEAEPVINPLLRAEKTKALLDQIERKPTDQQKEESRNELTENDVENALKKSQSGSAAGIDGATYDLWKTLNE
ncbi:hypothetical protein EUX98_g9603 [Antrodiella citrinella]|uniref:Endonuclease/exonuclease/phosphatase domain-containing protein n=1 Tax=Antrodiella citrinella TaxID=2447956 RepID=A0A4S4LQY8_9APHY|nr:hypothetical protein EUX98_g9603 [Antrodiella citrinella]